MTAALRDLATTRLASLCLNRRGRPRGFTFDDYLVRGGLILDLAVAGALTHTEDAVELDHDRAAEIGLADEAAAADEGETGLQWWLDWGSLGFDDWRGRLVHSGVWRLRPWSPWRPFRSFEDTERARTDADRAAGALPRRDGSESPQTLVVLAMGSISGLLGPIDDPPSWVMEDMGEAQWAGELVIERLTELRIRMRSIARAVD